MPHASDVIAAAVLLASAAVCAWIGYLNVRDRWREPGYTEDGSLPFSLRPRITLRAWIGGACGFVAFLCLLFLFRKLR